MSIDAIDLSTLDAPSLIEELDFETVFSELVTLFQSYMPSYDVSVESDPIYKVLQTFAYRELLLRQRVNDSARQCMVAYATDSNLDNLAALFGVERKTGETDDELRKRVTLALFSVSTAGSEGSYVYWALTVDGVTDAAAYMSDPGEVTVTVMAEETEDTVKGVPTAAQLLSVENALNSEDVRPLTDTVIVQAVTPVDFSVDATLYFYSGPDSSTVLQAAKDSLDEFLANQNKVGRDISESGILAALHKSGVSRVELTSPTGDVVITKDQVGYCTGISVINGGDDDE